ncbi:restriction endonuclease subunit S [[Eubacterium] eligens]|jgi:type I restriction-modification system specificity determinant|uniref:Restriction endonuclease subunit S n=1 Tax=Lachnospira eligens TaxID=39485 RepID=A0A7C9LEX7_9FIRM|nr:restriction endonuclease subunit S [Lachnospira eligens]MSC58356.1 restriction endonuclease subunit S [Lachnospira eligens]
MKCKLSDICVFRKGKVDVSKLTLKTYISTENMLPNKGGVTEASSLPTVQLTQEYKKGDILVSNIRPYFKKIWQAKCDGGCSNDVLVFQGNSNIDGDFLYYILANDDFFAYSMATSKGTKMPRGDKTSIMQYEVPIFDIDTQRKIASVLRSLDEKIELNSTINNNLEEQLSALFVNMFGHSIDSLDNSDIKLGDLIESVDNRGKTPPLSDEPTDYPIIDVRALSSNSRIIDYTNCTKYVSKETYNNWFRSGHPKEYDILISTVGSLAEMKIFLGTIGCIAQNVVGFRTKDISPLYLYQYLNYIKNDLVAYNIGSVQPSIKVTHIIKHSIYVASKEDIEIFDSIARNITKKIFANCQENEALKQMRDTLLPKLMSGEFDVSNIKI